MRLELTPEGWVGGCLKYAATLKNTHRKSLPTGWAQTGTGAALSTLLVSLSYLFSRSSTGESAVTARHVRPYELIRQVRTGYMFVLADGDLKRGSLRSFQTWSTSGLLLFWVFPSFCLSKWPPLLRPTLPLYKSCRLDKYSC